MPVLRCPFPPSGPHLNLHSLLDNFCGQVNRERDYGAQGPHQPLLMRPRPPARGQQEQALPVLVHHEPHAVGNHLVHHEATQPLHTRKGYPCLCLKGRASGEGAG